MTVPPSAYPDRLRPRPFEVATSLAFGLDDESPPLKIPRVADPRRAIEAVVREALTSPPCVVSFSGGRDSSAVLATAAAVARREGLDLPVPVTLRFPEAPRSDESEWQEQLVRHLRLPDWQRLEMTSEIDLLGPFARTRLLRHGLLWPPLIHFSMPILAVASGGTMLSGVGGDEIITGAPLGPLRGRGWLRRSNLRRLAMAVAPRRVRRARLARRRQLRFPWLLPEVEAEVLRVRTDQQARHPDRWDHMVAHWWRTRYRAAQAASLQCLAEDAGSAAVHVFLEPSVVGAVARHFGMRGQTDRTAAFRQVFGDVLPEAVIVRRTKAIFTEVFFGDHTRAFAASWTGAGVDPGLVDPERLASEWRSPQPDPRSSLLLQAAWLAQQVR